MDPHRPHHDGKELTRRFHSVSTFVLIWALVKNSFWSGFSGRLLTITFCRSAGIDPHLGNHGSIAPPSPTLIKDPVESGMRVTGLTLPRIASTSIRPHNRFKERSKPRLLGPDVHDHSDNYSSVSIHLTGENGWLNDHQWETEPRSHRSNR